MFSKVSHLIPNHLVTTILTILKDFQGLFGPLRARTHTAQRDCCSCPSPKGQRSSGEETPHDWRWHCCCRLARSVGVAVLGCYVSRTGSFPTYLCGSRDDYAPLSITNLHYNPSLGIRDHANILPSQVVSQQSHHRKHRQLATGDRGAARRHPRCSQDHRRRRTLYFGDRHARIFRQCPRSHDKRGSPQSRPYADIWSHNLRNLPRRPHQPAMSYGEHLPDG